MPFGASISCAIFQEISNAIHAVIIFRLNRCKTGSKAVTNYLDDFLFIACLKATCNEMVTCFMTLCSEINMPLSEEKTEWADTFIVFLGILLDGIRKLLIIPEEKRIKAINVIKNILMKSKATVKEIQCLTGLLNFLTKVIIPGRAFTRRLYSKIGRTGNQPKKPNLKHYHHIYLDKEFKWDCETWLIFLENVTTSVMCRPFLDKLKFKSARNLDFYSDASLSEKKGFGCVSGIDYTWGQWDPHFIQSCKPSIEYLELYALITGLMIWGDRFKNENIIVYCDNQAVVHMINNTSSSCRNCMVLIRIMVLEGLIYNHRVFARFIPTKSNGRADALSSLDFKWFFHLSPLSACVTPTKLPASIWPPTKIWVK